MVGTTVFGDESFVEFMGVVVVYKLCGIFSDRGLFCMTSMNEWWYFPVIVGKTHLYWPWWEAVLNSKVIEGPWKCSNLKCLFSNFFHSVLRKCVFGHFKVTDDPIGTLM